LPDVKEYFGPRRIIKKVRQTIGPMMSLPKRYLTMTVDMAASGVNRSCEVYLRKKFLIEL
jgi:hypothetical protein